MPVHNHSPSCTIDGNELPSSQALRIQGPVVQVVIEIPDALAEVLQAAGETPPSPVGGLALIDTGASHSVMDVSIAGTLRLNPVNVRTLTTPGGEGPRHTYPAKFSFPGTQLREIEFSEVIGSDLASGRNVHGHAAKLVAVLGRDVLKDFVLIYNGPIGQFSLCY